MVDGGGEEAKWTYGFYHETASAFHPKRSCGQIARSLVAHRSSTVYQVSSGHLSTGGDGRSRSRGDRGAWTTYWCWIQNAIGFEVQQWGCIDEEYWLNRKDIRMGSHGFESRWWWFLDR